MASTENFMNSHKETSVLNETFYGQILPIILVCFGIILTYTIAESNIDTLTIFEKYFYLPFVFAFILCKLFYKKFFGKFGSQVFSFVILSIVFVIFLPLGNRLYVQKSYKLSHAAVNGVDDSESGRVGSGYFLKSHYVKVEVPSNIELNRIVTLPVDKKTFEECMNKKCVASFDLNLGLLGAHFVSDVKVSNLNNDVLKSY